MLVNTLPVQHLRQFVRTVYMRRIVKYKPEATVSKRAQMLVKLIQDNDKKKNWHLQLGATGSPNENIYHKVERPHRRASVLNSLFMKNITDVLSTGDVCPEVIGYSVQITAVKVTSDYGLVNVYWQIPDVEDAPNDDVDMLLAKSAVNIRVELIRRNVLGKVPRIFFIRDPTNKRAADFQRCLEASGVDKIKDPPTGPAEDLMKNVFKFTEGRGENPKKNAVKKPEKPTKAVHPAPVPERPPDMKSDIMGLNHELILNKVLASKKSIQTPSSAAHHATEDGGEPGDHNTVYSIPATPLRDEREHEKEMKKFCIDRKTQWAKMIKRDNQEIIAACNVMPRNETSEVVDESFEEDYFDEEYEDTNDRPV